jgi:hypothetical protein
MTTTDYEAQSNSPNRPSRRSHRKTTKSERYAEQCKPLPPVAGESLEERVDRLDRSLDYLTQCFQDEFEVRDEGSLLVNVITQVLIPFAAISAAISLVYVRIVQWASTNYPGFERTAALSYLVLLTLVLLVLVFARRSGCPAWINRVVDRTEDRFHASVPTRKETLTRNNLVNQWIYVWIVGAILVFIPVTFIVLRSGVAYDFGVRLAIDTAGVCEGSGRIRIFTGGETCVKIQEEHAPHAQDTTGDTALGDTVSTSLSPVEFPQTPIDAQVAEIRLDATTTLALTAFVLAVGICANMGVWWWRNRRVREIDLL